MFAYCLNNPVRRRDTSGDTSADIFDEDGNPATNDDLRFDGGKVSNGGFGGFCEAFRSSLRDGLKGLKMAAGQRDLSHKEKHHLISNKRTLSKRCMEIITDYNYSLDDSSNIVSLEGHRGRHTNAYHEFIYYAIEELNSLAKGSYELFVEGMKVLGEFIQEYSWLPYARKE